MRTAGFPEKGSLALASIVETARSEIAVFDRETLVDQLCDEGLPEELSEVFVAATRNCFPAQRFATWFDKVGLTVALVRAKLSASAAENFLAALEPCVITPHTSEPRVRIEHPPKPGRVVMCDFRHLSKPEMQKERRAIVVSSRSSNSPNRCAVIPVSMTRSRQPHPHHYEFPPGSYKFFSSANPVWAVCDHIYTVSLHRLWLVNVRRTPQSAACLSAEDLQQVRKLAGAVIGFAS